LRRRLDIEAAHGTNHDAAQGLNTAPLQFLCPACSAGLYSTGGVTEPRRS
jgi:hypothetical protein